jgi:nitrate/nitrite transport system ATP-binding protein
LLADRIIPLSAGPNATLGPSLLVDLPRPRDRKAINHEPRYKEIRRDVINFLLGEGGHKHTAVSRKLILPDIRPEDLSVPRPLMGWRRTPIRTSEMKRETVDVVLIYDLRFMIAGLRCVALVLS